MKPDYHFLKITTVLFLAMLFSGYYCSAETITTLPADSSVSGPDGTNVSSSGIAYDQPIRIGVLANRGSDIAMQEWGPTAGYLARVLAPLQFVIFPVDFNETYEAVKQKNFSFICTNPSVYVDLEYNSLVQGIATLQVPGDPTPQAVYGAVIFTTSDHDDIRTLTDLKGKSFAAVDPTSLGGWQAADSELLKAGITPDMDFTSLNFTKTHDAAVYAVLNRTADAGTVRSTQLERMEKEGKIDISKIKILNDKRAEYPSYPYLLSTPLYPEWPFATVTGTDQELSEKVSNALLTMDEKDPAAIAVRGAGWAVLQDHSTVDALLKQLNLPPYESKGNATIGQESQQNG